jgi:hypothetical protein
VGTRTLWGFGGDDDETLSEQGVSAISAANLTVSSMISIPDGVGKANEFFLPPLSKPFLHDQEPLLSGSVEFDKLSRLITLNVKVTGPSRLWVAGTLGCESLGCGSLGCGVVPLYLL